jgi:lysophospholipase L1-like esterase
MTAKRLLILGDSIAFGTTFAATPWSSILQTERRGQRFGVTNAAVPGYTSTQALAQFTASYDEAGYTHLLVLVGTNDLAAGTASATILANLESLRVAALAAGLDTTFCTILPRGTGPSYSVDLQTRLDAVNEGIRAMPAIAVVDLYTAGGEPGTPTQLKATWDWGDGLHTNTAGHVGMAAAVNAEVAW